MTRGGRGGYGNGGGRRDNYRDGGGPDRHHHGGNRSRTYQEKFSFVQFIYVLKIVGLGDLNNVSNRGVVLERKTNRVTGRLFTNSGQYPFFSFLIYLAVHGGVLFSLGLGLI